MFYMKNIENEISGTVHFIIDQADPFRMKKNMHK